MAHEYHTPQDQDEDTLKANLISYGPISVACDASEWSFYTGGVVTSSTCKNSGVKLDHAIQLVGFNEDAETPYWIGTKCAVCACVRARVSRPVSPQRFRQPPLHAVRNSWSTSWGNDGYIYLKMGDNTCGIADAAWMVTL